MRTQTAYMTIAEYRRIAEEIARQIAVEERSHKRKPNRAEVFGQAPVPNPVSDVDYG